MVYNIVLQFVDVGCSCAVVEECGYVVVLFESVHSVLVQERANSTNQF